MRPPEADIDKAEPPHRPADEGAPSAADGPPAASGPDTGVLATGTALGSGASGAYAQVAGLLHESRGAAPDEVGSFLAERAAQFGMRDLSVYVTDYEQHDLVPITGSCAI